MKRIKASSKSRFYQEGEFFPKQKQGVFPHEEAERVQPDVQPRPSERGAMTKAMQFFCETKNGIAGVHCDDTEQGEVLATNPKQTSEVIREGSSSPNKSGANTTECSIAFGWKRSDHGARRSFGDQSKTNQ